MVARPRWRPKPAPKPVEDGRLSTPHGATINPQPDSVVLGRFLCGESVSRALSATADPAKPSHATSTAIQTRMIGSRVRAEVKTSRPPRARAEASQRMGTGGYESEKPSQNPPNAPSAGRDEILALLLRLRALGEAAPARLHGWRRSRQNGEFWKIRAIGRVSNQPRYSQPRLAASFPRGSSAQTTSSF